MKHNLKTKALGLSALALVGSLIPATGCSANQTSEFFTVSNNTGLEIEFCDFGASIYSMKYKDTYITYHQKDKNVFMNRGGTPYFHGKTLGRVTGRFKDGKMKLDGKEYQLQVNETGYPKNNCLHGGKDAFVYKNFKHYISEDNSAKWIAFNYFSPAMEAGFPEAIDAWIVYKLYKDVNKIDVDLFANPTGRTVIDLCTHPSFTLANEGDILDYTLEINTTTKVKYENETNKDKNGQIPDGFEDATQVADGAFNFKGGKKIGKDIKKAKEYDPVSGGYDHIWSFNNVPLANRYVKLTNPANKLSFTVKARTESITGVILYANDYPLKDTIMQPDGQNDRLYSGITIEPYTYFTGEYSAIDPTGHPGLEPITYTPDKPFHNAYSYEISKEE